MWHDCIWEKLIFFLNISSLVRLADDAPIVSSIRTLERSLVTSFICSFACNLNNSFCLGVLLGGKQSGRFRGEDGVFGDDLLRDGFGTGAGGIKEDEVDCSGICCGTVGEVEELFLIFC